MKKFFLKLFLFLAVLYAVLLGIDYFYTKKLKNIHLGKASYVINIRNKHLDYVVGGSSRVHNNFNTNLFDSLTGTTGYNIGYTGSGIAQNYITLYLFLKNGNTTKNYIQQVDEAGLSKIAFNHPFYEYFFMHYLSHDENVDRFYKSNVSYRRYLTWKYFPAMKYLEYNNYCRLSNIITNKGVPAEEIKNKGYDELEAKHSESFPPKSYPAVNSEYELDTLSVYYLYQINKLCKEHGVNYICYTSPVHPASYLSYKPANLKVALQNYLSSCKIQYYNFALEKKFDGDSLFYDESHLNSTGTNIFTQQLALTIKQAL